ncbi:MAG: hypothetical protein V4653_03335 [Pseudomonadota bacterium]
MRLPAPLPGAAATVVRASGQRELGALPARLFAPLCDTTPPGGAPVLSCDNT